MKNLLTKRTKLIALGMLYTVCKCSNKSIRNLLLLLFILPSSLCFSQNTEWQNGTKWVYDHRDGIEKYHQMTITGDTSVLGLASKKVTRDFYALNQYYDVELNKRYEKWEKGWFYEVIAVYTDSILWFNKTKNRFDKLYDYTLAAGDSLVVNEDFTYKILSVKDSVVNGVSVKIQEVDGSHKFTNIQGIGSTRDFFEPSDNYMVTLGSIRNLLCFQHLNFNQPNTFCNPERLITAIENPFDFKSIEIYYQNEKTYIKAKDDYVAEFLGSDGRKIIEINIKKETQLLLNDYLQSGFYLSMYKNGVGVEKHKLLIK